MSKKIDLPRSYAALAEAVVLQWKMDGSPKCRGVKPWLAVDAFLQDYTSERTSERTYKLNVDAMCQAAAVGK